MPEMMKLTSGLASHAHRGTTDACASAHALVHHQPLPLSENHSAVAEMVLDVAETVLMALTAAVFLEQTQGVAGNPGKNLTVWRTDAHVSDLDWEHYYSQMWGQTKSGFVEVEGTAQIWVFLAKTVGAEENPTMIETACKQQQTNST